MCGSGYGSARTPPPQSIATARKRRMSVRGELSGGGRRAAISGESLNMHKRTRCLICREKIPPWNKFFCDYCYRGRKPPGDCLTCGRRLAASYHGSCRYCSRHCRTYKLPAVYRWVCPDGRSYVGSTYNHELRLRCWGLKPSNSRLASALKKYPAQT